MDGLIEVTEPDQLSVDSLIDLISQSDPVFNNVFRTGPVIKLNHINILNFIK